MSDPRYEREGETLQQYIGDGVYAAFDGYQIWLRAERDGMVHEIALEFRVMAQLDNYAKSIWRTK